MMDMLRISGLRNRFGSKEVLRGLDLAVPEHSVFGFLGKNGAGKTTTMKTVLGLLKADGGEIAVNGEKVLYGQTATNRWIGHIEFYLSDPSLKKLLGMGLYLGLDMIGKKSGWGDEYRADTVRKIKRWGCLDQLLLSMDLCRKDDLRSAGGYGYAYLFESFIPMLEKRGITGDEIDRMLRKNPKKALAFVQSRADT